jgi:hypothetical protein
MRAAGFQSDRESLAGQKGSRVPSSAVTRTRVALSSAYPSSMKQFGRSPVASTIASEEKCSESKIAIFINAQSLLSVPISIQLIPASETMGSTTPRKNVDPCRYESPAKLSMDRASWRWLHLSCWMTPSDRCYKKGDMGPSASTAIASMRRPEKGLRLDIPFG